MGHLGDVEQFVWMKKEGLGEAKGQTIKHHVSSHQKQLRGNERTMLFSQTTQATECGMDESKGKTGDRKTSWKVTGARSVGDLY